MGFLYPGLAYLSLQQKLVCGRYGGVSNQSTFATLISPLTWRMIPHVAMSQKFVSQQAVSSCTVE
jgi:hypothetical protein